MSSLLSRPLVKGLADPPETSMTGRRGSGPGRCLPNPTGSVEPTLPALTPHSAAGHASAEGRPAAALPPSHFRFLGGGEGEVRPPEGRTGTPGPQGLADEGEREEPSDTSDPQGDPSLGVPTAGDEAPLHARSDGGGEQPRPHTPEAPARGESKHDGDDERERERQRRGPLGPEPPTRSTNPLVPARAEVLVLSRGGWPPSL